MTFDDTEFFEPESAETVIAEILALATLPEEPASSGSDAVDEEIRVLQELVSEAFALERELEIQAMQEGRRLDRAEQSDFLH